MDSLLQKTYAENTSIFCRYFNRHFAETPYMIWAFFPFFCLKPLILRENLVKNRRQSKPAGTLPRRLSVFLRLCPQRIRVQPLLRQCLQCRLHLGFILLIGDAPPPVFAFQHADRCPVFLQQVVHHERKKEFRLQRVRFQILFQENCSSK